MAENTPAESTESTQVRERRAIVSFRDSSGLEFDLMIVRPRTGESDADFAARADRCAWSQRGVMPTGRCASHVVTLSERTVTPWRSFDA